MDIPLTESLSGISSPSPPSPLSPPSPPSPLSPLSSLSSHTFSFCLLRPNWLCRSSWPKLWQLASCPAPSPSPLCAQWPPTPWLCATQWAPPPSSRPPSWALHCSGLPQGRCGPHTPPSSSPLTEDFTCSPYDLSLPFTAPQAPLGCQPHDRAHMQTMQPTLTHSGASAQAPMLSRPWRLRALHIAKAKISHHALFLLLLFWPERRTDLRAVAGAQRPVLIAIGQYGWDGIV